MKIREGGGKKEKKRERKNFIDKVFVFSQDRYLKAHNKMFKLAFT